MRNSTAPVLTFGLVLSLLVASGCSNGDDDSTGGVNNGSEGAVNGVRGERVADLRSMEDELAYVRRFADSVSMNDAGHWEATFENGIVMIYVPSGEFTMGNDALTEDVVTGAAPAAPAHGVTLTHYWIAKTPVTRGQFRAFVAATGYYITSVERDGADGCFVYDFDEHGFIPTRGYTWRNAFEHVTERHPSVVITDEHPVNSVSWDDATAFANWFAGETELPFRLPTEAQWEYAARGDDGRPYPWGTAAPDGTLANYADDSFDAVFPETGQSIVHHGVDDGYAATSPVGSYPAGASPVGALDMAGNVTEWVYDYLDDFDASGSALTDPLGPVRGDVRAAKAGFWAGSAGRFGQTPNEIVDGHNIRADGRQGDEPVSADDHLGFRLAIGYIVR
ncbi:MAG: hypothetical protein CSB44_10260 [Gammaproteobacteria bacterium]|nr:MAG: hypothetical protein CSB44_10260 [Gammaproteobacteria bacterium]